MTDDVEDMTLGEALAVELACGKCLGNATREDFREDMRRDAQMVEWVNSLDWITDDDYQAINAWLERSEKINEAIAVFKGTLPARAMTTMTRGRSRSRRGGRTSAQAKRARVAQL